MRRTLIAVAAGALAVGVAGPATAALRLSGVVPVPGGG
jgi:hypothetical protein